MTFSESIKTCFGKYVDFSGRASRSEYWWFTLFSIISQIVLNFIPFVGWIFSLALLLPSLSATARRLHDTDRTAWWMLLYLVPVLSLMAISIMIIVLIGISLSDSGEETVVAWGIFGIIIIFLIISSIVSAIVLLIFLVLAGTEGPNRYGPDPLRQVAGVAGLGGLGHHYAAPHSAGEAGASNFDSEHIPGSPSQGSASGWYCSQCGKELRQGAQFCTECGSAV